MFKTAIIVFVLASAGMAQLTQNLDTSTVLASNTLACRNTATFLTTDNSWWRSYDLPTEGIFQNIELTGITFGVEAAFSGNGQGQPMEIRIYRDPTVPQITPVVDLQPIYVERLIIQDTQLAVITHTFVCPVFIDAASPDCLVVEFFAPDGQSAGNQFFIGSNSGGETEQNYLSSPSGCTIAEPVPVSLLGAPNMHLLQVLHWSLPGTTGPQITYPGTCEQLAMFSGVNGALPTDGVGHAAKNVFAGDQIDVNSSSILHAFDGAPFFVLGTVVTNGSIIPDITAPSFPGFYYIGGNTFVIIGDSPIPGLVFQLPPQGVQFGFSWPGQLTGFTLMIQGIAISQLAANHIFASTNGHELIGL